MQGHGAIEVSFGGTHPNGNCRHLNDLRRMLSNHVASQHPIGLLLHHQLEQTAGAGGWQRPRHRTETGTMHHNTAWSMTFDGLLFG